MRGLNYMLLLMLILQNVSCEEDEYVYDDSAVTEVASAKGTRLVGAARADVSDLPFIVGYNMETIAAADYVICTGTLITQQWVLSAAHCILQIVPKEDLGKCLQESKVKGSFEVTSPNNKKKAVTVKCELDPVGNTKVYLLKPGGTAYFNVEDVNNKDDVAKGDKYQIEYYIRHVRTYPGGGNYGTYGGIDVTLLHLQEPVDSKNIPACLPKPTFQDTDIKGNLAGFGKYIRKECQTDEYGPAKYHYCKGSCDTKTVPPQPNICRKFFNSPISKQLGSFEDIMLVDSRRQITYCYASESPKVSSAGNGWCPVESDASIVGQIKKDKTWGFCGKDCNLKESGEPVSAVLRRVDDIDILNEDMCEKFLASSLGSTVEVKPQILCIGLVAKVNIQGFKIKGNGFAKIKKPPTQFHKYDKILPGSGIYIHAAGTCQGDSGGPVYVRSESSDKFVVLGAVSGGRGRLGDCGGVNNPTHYVRVKKITPWIRKTIGKDAADLCFVDN